MQVKDKVVIVTGASSGIGEATAKLFAQKGAKVVLAARSKNKLEKLAKDLPNSLVVPTDMTNVKDIEALVQKTVKEFGRVDILINNAGRGYDAPVEEISADTFHQVFDLDLLGPVLAMQQVIPLMRKQGNGVIVNISSGTALMVLPNMSGYASLKQALAKISLTAREELKKDKIKVIVVYPYITDTDFEKNTIREGKEPEWDGSSDRELPPADSPEFVAEKILEGIQKDTAEIYAHDWMKR
ncbi:MAG TPA: SDR family oxidoreductase [Candidatus Acidoferrales bacterium]|nr:SDR family oxidoreductase [Candidatus Acidoferrales bacterium]